MDNNALYVNVISLIDILRCHGNYTGVRCYNISTFYLLLRQLLRLFSDLAISFEMLWGYIDVRYIEKKKLSKNWIYICTCVCTACLHTIRRNHAFIEFFEARSLTK